MWSRFALATAVSIPNSLTKRTNVNSSPALAKLKALVASKSSLGVSFDVPRVLAIFIDEREEPVTASFEPFRNERVLALSSGALRVKFFLPVPDTFELEGGVGNVPEMVVIPFPGGKLRLWER